MTAIKSNSSIVAPSFQIKKDLIFSKETLLFIIQQEVKVLIENFDSSELDQIDIFNFFVITKNGVILLINMAAYIAKQRVNDLLIDLELFTGILEEVFKEIRLVFNHNS